MRYATETLLFIVLLLLAAGVAAADPLSPGDALPGGVGLPDPPNVPAPPGELEGDYLFVSLVAPAHDASVVAGRINFTFDVLASGTVGNCVLKIDGDTVASQAYADGPTTFEEELEEGDYQWTVTCTDGDLTNESATFDLEVLDEILDENATRIEIDRDDGEYLPGETIVIDGSRFSPLANVDLSFKKGSATVGLANVIAEDDGTFSYEYVIGLADAAGNYTIIAENADDSAESAEEEFTLLEPSATLWLSLSQAVPGDDLTINGFGFLAGDLLNITVDDEVLLDDGENISADDQGSFSLLYTIPDDAAEGEVTFTALSAATDRYTASMTLNVSDETVEVNETCSDGIKNQDETNVDCGGACTDVNGEYWYDDECHREEEVVVEDDDGDEGDDAGEDEPVFLPPSDDGDRLPPGNEEPAPIDYPDLRDDNNGSGGSWWVWLLILLLVVVLVAGGFVGFLAYEGNLDISSPDAFIDGVKTALGLKEEKPANLFLDPREKSPFGDKKFEAAKGATDAAGDTASAVGAAAAGTAAAATSVSSAATSISSAALSTSTPPAIPATVDPQDFATLKNFVNGERSKGYDDLTIRNALLKKGWEEPEVDAVFDRLYKE